jgi:hypothetical protein
MIKFFRKIRQNLLIENKTAKYFKYATGEIILVVIGILIAIQINNWNENQKLKKNEKVILLDLKQEFTDNLKIIDTTLYINLINISASVNITEEIRKKNKSLNLNILDTLFPHLGAINSLKLRRGVTDQMINSGKLEIIANTKLKSLITNWTSQLEKSENDIKYAIENYTTNLMPYLMKHFPLSNAEIYKQNRPVFVLTYKNKSNFGIDYTNLNLLEFENQIWHHKHNLDYLILRDNKIKKLTEAILKEIKLSLKQV